MIIIKHTASYLDELIRNMLMIEESISISHENINYRIDPSMCTLYITVNVLVDRLITELQEAFSTIDDCFADENCITQQYQHTTMWSMGIKRNISTSYVRLAKYNWIISHRTNHLDNGLSIFYDYDDCLVDNTTIDTTTDSSIDTTTDHTSKMDYLKQDVDTQPIKLTYKLTYDKDTVYHLFQQHDPWLFEINDYWKKYAHSCYNITSMNKKPNDPSSIRRGKCSHCCVSMYNVCFRRSDNSLICIICYQINNLSREKNIKMINVDTTINDILIAWPKRDLLYDILQEGKKGVSIEGDDLHLYALIGDKYIAYKDDMCLLAGLHKRKDIVDRIGVKLFIL
jgi:hypothetical protein